jgi:hypothetical protein
MTLPAGPFGMHEYKLILVIASSAALFMLIVSLVAWVGSGLDTAPSFRNIHNYPLKHTKTNLIDYISGMYFIDQETLFSIGKNMDLEPSQNEQKKNELIAEFNHYKAMNDRFTRELKLIPDSVYEHYCPEGARQGQR